MLVFATLALALGASAQPTESSLQSFSPEKAAEHVRGCGFKDVRIKEDRELQEDVVVVSGVNSTTDFQLRCVVQQSMAFNTYVEFPARLNPKYQRVYSELERAADRIEARGWLEHRGLLSKLPTYEKGKTDDLEFARKLESLCGSQARGAFYLDHGMMTMKIGTIQRPAFDDQTFECLTKVSAASGFPVGFVGNEYYSAKERKPSRK